MTTILTPHMGISELCRREMHMHSPQDPWCRESRPRMSGELVNVYTGQGLS